MTHARLGPRGLARLLVFIAAVGLLTPRLAFAQSFTAAALSAAVSSTTATTLTVDSASGMSQGQWLYVDREAMRITDVSGTTITVIRGIQGIVTTHGAGATVYVAASSAFNLAPPPNNSCSTPSTLNLYIDVQGGGIYQCVNQVWRTLNIVGPAPVGSVLVGNGPYAPPSFTTISASGVAPADATYLLKTANSALPNAQAMGALSTGLVFNTTTTGVQSTVVCATAGTVLIGGAPPTCSATPTVTSMTLGTLTFSGGQSLVGTTADSTEIYRGTNPQSFFVYGTRGSSSNYEAFEAAYNSGSSSFVIGPVNGGTGSARPLDFFASNTRVWRIATNGSIADLGSHSITVGASVVTGAGAVGTPSFTFAGSTTSGFYVRASDVIGLSFSGVEYFDLSADSFNLKSTVIFGWGATTASSAPDTRLIRASAGVIQALGASGADTATVKANIGSFATLTATGTITFAGLASASGVRYVCASTTGVLDGQAAACVGTEATMAQYAKDGYVVLTRDEYADFVQMRSQFKFSVIKH